VTENASKNQLDVRMKIFIVLYEFYIAELFLMTRTKCLLYYSSSSLIDQAVKCLDQFYKQFKEFNSSVISVQVQHESDVRLADGTPTAEFLCLTISVSLIIIAIILLLWKLVIQISQF